MSWLPVDEAASALGRKRRWLWDVIKRHRLPTKREKVGRTYRTLVDFRALTLALGKPEALADASQLAPVSGEAHQGSGGFYELARSAEEYNRLPRGLRWDLVREVARRLEVSEEYAYRLIRRYQEEGPKTLQRSRRDKGQHRVPAELRQLVLGLKLAHPGASANRILRIIELNDPDLLRYKPYQNGSTLFTLSPSTVRRLIRAAESIPAFRWALLSDEGRKEFARTWAGHVMAEYPMQMVMVDMTRCDLFVYNPDEGSAYRLRIHVALDVFSGASPSLVFSREEGQVPTDQLLILMTQDKSGLAPGWDVYGVPEKIYWDNGKVYRSEKSEHFARQLGIELIYSRPRISHTRGRVERFFGAFHQEFEALLPGYAGKDATERDSTQLKRLIANTRAWVAAGMPADDDPYPNRLLLEEEYKARALAWLLQDWHRKPVDKEGFSRADLFRAYVPRHRLVRLDLGDLYLLTAHQTERVVRGNGVVAYRGRNYYLRPEDGSLIPWQGQKVIVLEVQVLPGQPLRAALRQPDGSLKVLGELIPEPLRADSLEAKAKRLADKAAIRAVREAAQELTAQLGPAVRFEEILERLSGLAPLARRERVRPMAQELPRPSEEELQAAAAQLEEGLDDLIWEPIALGEKWLRERGLLPPGEGKAGGEA